MSRSNIKSLILSIGVLSLCASPANGQSAELKQAVETAFVYTDVQQFDDALKVLSQVNEADRGHYLYDLTRARILTWSRNYPQARVEFDKLLAQYPDNPDILVPYAFLQLFDGDLLTAEMYFTKVLQSYPDYGDALIGLNRTQKLKREKRSIFETGYQVIENITD